MSNHQSLRPLLALFGLLLCLSWTPPNPPDVTGSWRMRAHRVEPAQEGVSDLYSHFKELYGGCQQDMGVTLNPDGSLKLSPVSGCQNPLGNLIMKAASKFMPSGKASWALGPNTLVLTDGKGQRREYGLQVSGSTMEWVFEETHKQNSVRHTIAFSRE